MIYTYWDWDGEYRHAGYKNDKSFCGMSSFEDEMDYYDYTLITCPRCLEMCKFLDGL